MPCQQFRFHLAPRNQKFTDSQLLAGLRRFARQHRARPFTFYDFLAWKRRPFNPALIRRRLGSWREGMRLIGLEAARTDRADPADLVADVERVWRQLGRSPTQPEFIRRARFPISAYIYYWRSIRKLCTRIVRHRKGEITRAQLLKPIPGAGASYRLSNARRLQIFARDHCRCTICGNSPAADPACRLHVDHIVPTREGGSNHPSNLRTLCHKCNLGRRKFRARHGPPCARRCRRASPERKLRSVPRSSHRMCK